MLTDRQFAKAKEFIFRHGRLLDRKRFSYYFEDGTKDAVLAVLACYQNDDGGFGNGLELDMMCPDSSGICTEVGLACLLEFDVRQGDVLDRAEQWVLSTQSSEGLVPHPTERLGEYPHGPWWNKPDNDRIFSIAGLLSQFGRGSDTFYSRVAALFENTHVPFPDEINVYGYPLHRYLRFANGADRFADELAQLKAAFPAMLEKEAWSCPLFCGDSWHCDDIEDTTWESEAAKAVATLQDDGGVLIEQYKQFPWWRPIWTLEMLVTMKKQGLLNIAD